MEGLIYCGEGEEERRLGVWAECCGLGDAVAASAGRVSSAQPEPIPSLAALSLLLLLLWLHLSVQELPDLCPAEKGAGVSQGRLPSVAWGRQAQPETVSGLVRWRPEAVSHAGSQHTSSVPHTDLSAP